MTSSTASQRVLFLPELLGIILEHLEYGDLAQVARLAIFAHHASIKLLWAGSGVFEGRHIWLRLRHLFPPGLVAERPSDQRWVFARPPENEDLTRFKHYSVYAKEIYINSCNFSCEYFAFFQGQSDELFPNLRLLGFEWSLGATYYKECEWSLLAGPSLRSIWIGQWWEEEVPPIEEKSLDSILSLLKALSSRASHLTSIALPSFSGGKLSIASTQGLVNLFSSTLQALPDLKAISWHWSDLPEGIISTIAMHPSLTSVGLSNGLPSPPSSSSSLFPALTHLDFREGTATALASLLGALGRRDRLVNVSPTVLLGDSPEEISSFSRAFSILGQTINLTRLDIVLKGYAMRLDWSSFRCLLECHSMIVFDMDTNASVVLDDEGLLELAKSWLDLESFGVLEESVLVGQVLPSRTILGLVHFAKHSPKLTSVSISVSLRMHGEESVTPEIVNKFLESEFSSSSRVATLDLAYSRFEIGDVGDHTFLEPRAVAHLVQKLFPAVGPAKLVNGWEDEPLEDERWGYVRDLLKEMAKAREAEGRRLKESELHKTEIGSLIRERDQLADERARLRRALEARDGTGL